MKPLVPVAGIPQTASERFGEVEDVSRLDELINRCVRAAYEEWTSPLPPSRPRRVVSLEDLERCAESTADIAAQVREELARIGLEPASTRRSPESHRRYLHRRAA